MATYLKSATRTARNGPPALGPQPDGKLPAQPAGPMGKSVAGQVGRMKVTKLTGSGGQGSKKVKPQRG